MGRVLDECDLAGGAPEQARDGLVHRRGARRDDVRGGVAPDSGFELEMLDHGVEHDSRRQRRTGVVEVRDVGAAGRVRPCLLDVDAHSGAGRSAQAAGARCVVRHSSQSSV